MVMTVFMVLVALGLGLTMVRLFSGPSLYDRVLAVNAFGTKTVMLLCLFGVWIGRADAIDIAMLYALLNFIATIAILKFFNAGNFNSALMDGNREGE
jgi:multicomponent Na+:H+ antiporter subunit F